LVRPILGPYPPPLGEGSFCGLELFKRVGRVFPWTQGIEAKGGAFIAFLRDAGRRSVRGLTAWLEAGEKGYDLANRLRNLGSESGKTLDSGSSPE